MVDALDLLDAVIVEGGLLTHDRGAGEVLEAGGVLVGRALGHKDADGVLDVGIGEVDGLTALLGIAHTGDDDVDLAVVKSIDKAVEGELHRHRLGPEGLCHTLGDLDVVAVCIGAGDVFDGDGVFALLGGLPVIGGIGCLHAYTQGGAAALL